MTWNSHVHDYAKVIYDVILGRYQLTALGLNLKFFCNVIKADGGTFKWSTAPMADQGAYSYKDLNTGNITPEESFMNARAE